MSQPDPPPPPPPSDPPPPPPLIHGCRRLPRFPLQRAHRRWNALQPPRDIRLRCPRLFLGGGGAGGFGVLMVFLGLCVCVCVMAGVIRTRTPPWIH